MVLGGHGAQGIWIPPWAPSDRPPSRGAGRCRGRAVRQLADGCREASALGANAGWTVRRPFLVGRPFPTRRAVGSGPLGAWQRELQRDRPTPPLDSRVHVAHTVRMGAIAAVVGLCQGVHHRPVVGQADEDLVARVRAGDAAAFEAIYDRYARGLLAFCVHMLGSHEAGEDALQLTFVSAYQALRNGRSDISLRPWMYTIARNRCVSELRVLRDAADLEVEPIDRRFPEGVAERVEQREQLHELFVDVPRIPDDQRAALVLFELGDHSHEQIAAVLDVRREKVKALIFQAREALMRGRNARDRPCAEIRERLATSRGRVHPRSETRAHI